MKCILVALTAVIAVAYGGILAPNIYSVGSPLAYGAPLVAAYTAYTPYAAAPLAVAPAIGSGYVAATRGSVHVAPHPEGPFTASHHINTAPAPGTF